MDDSAARLSGARIEAVSRVSAVNRAATSAPLDPARSTDPHDIGWLRPDPSAIAAGDILQFESLLQDVSTRRGAARPAAPSDVADPSWPGADAPAADRIVSTLRLLSRINGL